jgi:hypothetical protein
VLDVVNWTFDVPPGPRALFNFGIVRAQEMWSGDWQVALLFAHAGRIWSAGRIFPAATR